MSRLFIRTLAASTLIVLPSAVLADTVTAQVTADNVYSLYVGTPVGLTLLGTNNDWVTAESYSFSANAGDYVYIAAWDWSGIQGMQGIIEGTNGTFRSNGTDLVYTSIAASALTPWSASGSAAAPMVSLQAALQTATWLPITGISTHTASPWGARVADVGTLWVWGDTLNATSVTDGQLAVFRTINPVVASAVPEPTSSALLLAGLSVLGLKLGRRRQH